SDGFGVYVTGCRRRPEVTAALLLGCSAQTDGCRHYGCENSDFTFSSTNTQSCFGRNAENMKPTTYTRDRTFRFLSDRYAYRERPNYLAELAVFGIVAIITIWPMFSPADALVILR